MRVHYSIGTIFPLWPCERWLISDVQSNVVTSDLQSIYGSVHTTRFADEPAGRINWASEGNWKTRTDLVFDDGVPDILREPTDGLHVFVVFLGSLR